MSKILLTDIQDICNADGWIVLSDTYDNLNTLMSFECPEGHHVFDTWNHMRKKRICPTCDKNVYKMTNETVIPKSKNTKRILAIDQATHISGWSIYDNQQLIKYGTFETTFNDEIARCHQVKLWLLSMINCWHPDLIGFEDIQFQETSSGRTMGVTVFQTLAHLQGILMDAAFEQNIEFKLCSTNTWRHEIGVKGKTRTDRKRSMQRLVKDWFDVSVTEDEADAIGIGKYVAGIVSYEIKMENWE